MKKKFKQGELVFLKHDICTRPWLESSMPQELIEAMTSELPIKGKIYKAGKYNNPDFVAGTPAIVFGYAHVFMSNYDKFHDTIRMAADRSLIVERYNSNNKHQHVYTKNMSINEKYGYFKVSGDTKFVWPDGDHAVKTYWVDNSPENVLLIYIGSKLFFCLENNFFLREKELDGKFQYVEITYITTEILKSVSRKMANSVAKKRSQGIGLSKLTNIKPYKIRYIPIDGSMSYTLNIESGVIEFDSKNEDEEIQGNE